MFSRSLLLLISFLLKAALSSLPPHELVLRMPAEQSDDKENLIEEERCLCISVLLDPAKRYHIVGFTPLGVGENINHMALVSGVGFPSYCQEDEGKIKRSENGNGLKNGKEIWDREGWKCSMGGGKASETWQDLGSRTLYIWGQGAGGLKLPEGTALAVGGRKGERLVLQVHFKAGQAGGSAAVRVTYREEELGWGAGILSFHAGGLVLPFRFDVCHV